MLDKFCKALWQDDDIIEVRCFGNRDSNLKPKSFWVFSEDIPDMYNKLKKLNDTGYNIYAGVVPRDSNGGKEDSDCSKSGLIWCDIENISCDNTLKLLEDNDLPVPTLVLNSGHGVHCYWRLKEYMPVALISQIVNDLAVLIGSDPTVKNPSRVMRVTNFVNWKEPAKEAKVYQINNETYSFEDLRSKIPVNELSSPVDQRKSKLTGKVSRSRKEVLESLSKYLDKIPGVGVGNRNQAAYKACCHLRDFGADEIEALHLLKVWNTKNNPPLSENEIGLTIESAYKHAKGDMGSRESELHVEERPKRIKIKNRKKSNIIDELTETLKVQYNRKILKITQWPLLCKHSRILKPGTYNVIAGEPGVSKSLFALSLGKILADYNVPWKYLPLEMSRHEHLLRYAAIVDNNFELMDDTVGNTIRDRGALVRNKKAMEIAQKSILPNPLLDEDEISMHVEDLMEFLEEEAKKSRVIIIDPIGYINFGNKNMWDAHSEFVGFLSNLGRDTGVTIILVTHLVKKNAGTNAGLGDVEGGKHIVGKADSVIMIKMQPKGTVKTTKKMKEEYAEEREINRIISIGKGRHGEGTIDLGYQFGLDSPSFYEVGEIIKNSKKF